MRCTSVKTELFNSELLSCFRVTFIVKFQGSIKGSQNTFNHSKEVETVNINQIQVLLRVHLRIIDQYAKSMIHLNMYTFICEHKPA